MGWQRWHRVIMAVAWATAVIFIILPSLVDASPATVTIRPNAAGDETNLTPNTGTNWEAVDEVTSDDDTTYVADDAKSDVYQTDLYNLADITVSGKGKINSVTVYIHARALATPSQPSAHTRIKTNGVAYNGAEITLTTTYTTYSTTYTTNPQSGNEWTWAEINALQAGVGLRRALATGALGNRASRCTQVWVEVDYSPATLESYQDAAHTTVWGTTTNPYDNNNQTVYIYGENYTASHGYTVAYYDGDGIKVASDSVLSGADNTLASEYLLTTDPNATAGTWHAVVFDDDLGTPPATYAETSGAAGYMVEDSFEVAVSAIPEFPTIIAAIGVSGLCFGIYYWMRKRRAAHVKA